jgi:hypothetical protein
LPLSAHEPAITPAPFAVIRNRRAVAPDPLLLSVHVALSVRGPAEAPTLIAVIQSRLAITPLLLAVIFEKDGDRANAEDLTAYHRSDLQR